MVSPTSFTLLRFLPSPSVNVLKLCAHHDRSYQFLKSNISRRYTINRAQGDFSCPEVSLSRQRPWGFAWYSCLGLLLPGAYYWLTTFQIFSYWQTTLVTKLSLYFWLFLRPFDYIYLLSTTILAEVVCQKCAPGFTNLASTATFLFFCEIWSFTMSLSMRLHRRGNIFHSWVRDGDGEVILYMCIA